MNKRAQGLPLTTVIIAILVILVLVIVVFFFMGGMEGISSRIRERYTKVVAGTDVNLVIQACQTYCQQAQMMSVNLRMDSSYCKTTFNVDTDDDGKADLINKKCHDGEIGVYCDGVFEEYTQIGCGFSDAGEGALE